MWFPLLLNLCQTVFSKLILFLFLKMPPFPPSLHCTEVLIKCWNVKVNSSASRLVTRLMWYLLTDSNQLYLTPRSFPPVLLLVVVLSSALRVQNQIHPPQLCLESSGKSVFKLSLQCLFAEILTEQQGVHQEILPPPSVSRPWFLGGVLWRTSRPTFRPNVCK